MGQLWSIFFPKSSHSHQKISAAKDRERLEYIFGSEASITRSSGSRQKPTEYWSEAQLSGEISPKELAQQLRWQRYNVHPGHNGGKRTRKHTRNSNSTLKRSTRKQKRA